MTRHVLTCLPAGEPKWTGSQQGSRPATAGNDKHMARPQPDTKPWRGSPRGRQFHSTHHPGGSEGMPDARGGTPQTFWQPLAGTQPQPAGTRHPEPRLLMPHVRSREGAPPHQQPGLLSAPNQLGTHHWGQPTPAPSHWRAAATAAGMYPDSILADSALSSTTGAGSVTGNSMASTGALPASPAAPWLDLQHQPGNKCICSMSLEHF